MKLTYTAKTAFSGLRTNKSRSGLTILGIVIGITAIMMIMSAGQGAEGLILGQLGGMGSDVLFVRPGREPKGPSDMAETMFSKSLKDREIDALRRKSNVPGLKDLSPIVMVTGSVSYGSETFKPTIIGWSAEYMGQVFDIYPSEGMLFGESDVRARSSVAVIGSKVKTELFGDAAALGKAIKIKGRSFIVVGILAERGQLTFFNVDELVLIPPTTAQLYILGTDHYNEIVMRAESADKVTEVERDVKTTLRELHNITDPSKDDFFVVTQEGLVEQVSVIMSVLTTFLTAVVAISLVVGGIGVMNIMLVSVTERTREIGLRKALGATESDILRQFLFEAVMLTGIGGVIGILLGIGLSFLTAIGISQALAVDWTFSIPVTAAFLGLGVSSLVGVVFGIYPARQAARKDPIEALRYE